MLWKKDVKRFADALRRLNATSIRHGLGPQDSVTPDLFSDLAEELDRAATVSPEEPGSHLENMTFDHSDGEVAELRKRLEAKDKALREFFEQAEEIGFKPRISATLIRDGAFA